MSQTIQTGPKWNKSGNLSYQNSVYFGSVSQSLLKSDLKKPRIFPIWPTLGPNLTSLRLIQNYYTQCVHSMCIFPCKLDNNKGSIEGIIFPKRDSREKKNLIGMSWTCRKNLVNPTIFEWITALSNIYLYKYENVCLSVCLFVCLFTFFSAIS